MSSGRFTIRGPMGDALLPETGLFYRKWDNPELPDRYFVGKAIDLLAEYEDIGLSPDEIEAQLATYSAVLTEVTNNKMSKTNYTLEAIRSAISDAQAEDCDRCDNTEQLKRYEEAEADGRLIILPVKEGTPLFVDGKIFASHCKGQVHEVTGWYYSYPMIYKDFRGEHDYVIDPDGIGTSTFLTREEAEAALKERYGKHE